MDTMRNQRLFHDVANKITQLIEQGVFSAGARLPGERDLADRFGVSRVTVREAEIALQALGRLEIKMGSGVYVSRKQPLDNGALPEISGFELIEARSLFESEAAALAAKNITHETLLKLEQLVNKMDDREDLDAAIEANRLFHLTIAEASKNRAVLHTVQSLWRMRLEVPAVRNTYETVASDDADCRAREHRNILDALKAHDPIAARNAMRQHFYRLLKAMLEATEQLELRQLQKRGAESRERFLRSALSG